MAAFSPDTARFRSATDFPKDTETLEREQADALYQEMRDCLIFTNRSRAQLVRRNTEHKDKTLELRDRITHFQSLIDQLQAQKQTQLQEKQTIIAQLASEMAQMGTQLDTLSEAFDAVGDPEAEAKDHWGYVSLPQRFMKLIRAVKVLMQWWHSKDDDSRRLRDQSHPAKLVDDLEDEQDKRDRPQLYSDQASINRSLLDR